MHKENEIDSIIVPEILPSIATASRNSIALNLTAAGREKP